MEQPASSTSPVGHTEREKYSLRNSSFQRSMVRRSAQRQAAFLLPHLRRGMHLLDCGSGPGSITSDLAELVAPGEVIGIDLDEGEVERATAYAAQLGIGNVEFRVGDIYKIPFADETFDAVYSNALLDHLRDPLAALREVYRVLKPGGIAAIRTADRDGYLVSPYDPLFDKQMKEGEAAKAAQGISVRIGKHIRTFLRQAGFARTEASASYDSYGTDEAIHRLVYGESPAPGEDSPQDTDNAMKQWAKSPDASFGHAFCEGLGWKE